MPVNPSRHSEGDNMTRIGMAIDPDRLHVMQRRRGRIRRAVEGLIAVFAVLLLAGNVVLVEQRGASTAVDEAALLAEFSSPPSSEADADPASVVAAPDLGVPAVDGEAGPATAGDDGKTQSAQDTDETVADDGSATPAGEPAAGAAAEGDKPGSSPAARPSPAEAPAAQSPAPPPPAAKVFAVPARGVYAYATEGWEKISLGGARHDYPERTFAVIEPKGGCEWTFDHRVLEEKRTVNTYCHEGPDQSVVAYDGWVTFFGSTAESHYTCTGTRADRRDQPGAKHQSQCTDGDATTSDVTTYLGLQELVIGGTSVRAMAYSTDTVIKGSITGTSHTSVWLRPEDGLPLRIERDTETSTYEFGTDVDYVEHAVFMAESLEPRR